MSGAVIIFGSDHAGFGMKAELKSAAEALGYAVADIGAHNTDSVDYPDIANALCARVLAENARGILICGSGIGVSIAANRHSGIRAALCHDGLSAELSRRHNDANVLCLGARLIGIEPAKEAIKRFLTTEFEGGRHQARIDKLSC